MPKSPNLLFTHGWQNDTTIWDGVVEALDGQACVAWDLPSHGAAKPLPNHGGVREQVLDLFDEQIAALDGPVVLVGHSLGGFYSLSHAITRPSVAAGIVLIATGPGFKSDAPREQWNQWVRDNANADRPGQDHMAFQHDSLVMDGLADIEVPVLVIVGERDRQYMPSVGVFEKRLSQVTTVTVPDAGHMVHVKKPEAVAVAIQDWLVECC